MDKTDTLPNTTTRPSLQELLTRARPAPEALSTVQRRRSDHQLGDDLQPESPSLVPDIPQHGLLRPSSSDVVLEQVTRQPYDLSYACLLIPRFSAHYLIGDIVESLHDWMRRICISFDWRLENIVIRPEYMQWVLYVPAATPPSHCIRTIREQTSRLIFDDFPHIKNENLSKDFWAPGYLVLVGPTPHPPEMINEYIWLTRQQQGIQPRMGR